MAKETVESLCQRAQQAVAKGQNERARQFYMHALAMRSDIPNIHYGLATVCYLMKDLHNAAHHFREVIRLDPLRAGAYINLGAICNKMNQLDEAIDLLRKGIQLDVKRAEGYYNLGLVYKRKGQNDLALQAYREATRVNPRMSDAHYNLGNVYMEQGQLSLAASHYEKALEVRPDWAKAQAAMEQIRIAIQGTAPDDEPTADLSSPDDEPTIRLPDPERMVDPEEHAAILKHLHKSTIDSENLSREFVHLLLREVEPAIKNMSKCLLESNQSRIELEHCTQKVESAIDHIEAARKTLRERVDEVKYFAEKLAKS